VGCCGQNRLAPPVETSGPPRTTLTSQAPSAQYFEYVGKTTLTAFGPVTGRLYRFTRPGALVPVDERDAPSMSGVPHLRKAPAPE